MQMSLLEVRPLRSHEETCAIQNHIDKLKRTHDHFLKVARTADGKVAKNAALIANNLKEEIGRLEGKK